MLNADINLERALVAIIKPVIESRCNSSLRLFAAKVRRILITALKSVGS